MTKKDLFKKAHEMAKEMIEMYNGMEIDYAVQFGLCVSYLAEEENNKKVVKVVISGDVTLEEEEELENVARAYADYYCDDECQVNFDIWNAYGYRRAYASYNKRSSYQNKKKNFYDLKSGILTDSYVRYER